MKIFCPTFSRSAFQPRIGLKDLGDRHLEVLFFAAQRDGVERFARLDHMLQNLLLR